MMRCNKCGKEVLMEQVPEVHISEAEVDCVDPSCDGTATYRNNKPSYAGINFAGIQFGEEPPSYEATVTQNIRTVLMEDDHGEHHG